MAQPEPDGPRGIHVYFLETGGNRTIVEPSATEYVQDVAWSPDGEHISYDWRTGRSSRLA